jgi:hypothetical protein
VNSEARQTPVSKKRHFFPLQDQPAEFTAGLAAERELHARRSVPTELPHRSLAAGALRLPQVDSNGIGVCRSRAVLPISGLCHVARVATRYSLGRALDNLAGRRRTGPQASAHPAAAVKISVLTMDWLVPAWPNDDV